MSSQWPERQFQYAVTILLCLAILIAVGYLGLRDIAREQGWAVPGHPKVNERELIEMNP